jgi:hypothetical protein
MLGLALAYRMVKFKPANQKVKKANIVAPCRVCKSDFKIPGTAFRGISQKMCIVSINK